MAVELRAGARYRLVDRLVVAERTGLGWWLLHGEASAGGVQLTWAIAPDGRIYQGSIEVVQTSVPATCVPLGPETDLTAADIDALANGPFGDGELDQLDRRSLE